MNICFDLFAHVPAPLKRTLFLYQRDISKCLKTSPHICLQQVDIDVKLIKIVLKVYLRLLLVTMRWASVVLKML